MHPDHLGYYAFTGRSRLDKAINSLLGIVEGISVDAKINNAEIAFLSNWLEAHQPYRDRHPFNELLPVVANSVADGLLTEDERSDVRWLCEKLRSTEYYDAITADLQRLHAIMGGIASDGVITKEKLKGLSEWLDDHNHLRRCWPYDEVDSIVTAVLTDQRIDEKEHESLRAFFDEFVALGENRAIARPLISTGQTVQGLCAVCPEIKFNSSLFCFTGASRKYVRSQFAKVVIGLGGRVSNSVTPALDYLIIGADGNPCWAYACYGRKVEKAVELRKEGYRLLLVHEHDFNDAVLDVPK